MKWLRRSYFQALLFILPSIVGVSLYYGLAEHNSPHSTSSVTAQSDPVAISTPAFVGRAVCANCHAEQDKRWQGSHHDLAMQEASEASVLGDFNAAEFSKHGNTTQFFRQNGRFMVRNDGADGRLADLEIKYTFGITPL